MGREAKARSLRRVVNALSLQNLGQLKPEAAAQYGVRVRTLRRAALRRQTGSFSMIAVAHAYCIEHKLKSTNEQDAIAWAVDVRMANPRWVPGDAVPVATA